MNIQFHTAPSAFGLRTASPFCLKVEAALRLSGRAFETVVSAPMRGPRKKIPFVIVDEGRPLPDSQLIIEELRKNHGLVLPAGPLPERRLAEEHLYWAVVHFRWSLHADLVRDGFFSEVPAVFRGWVFRMVHRDVRRALHGQGLGRRPDAEKLEVAGDDLAALDEAVRAGRLGGASLTETDLSVYAALHQLLEANYDDELVRMARSHAALRTFHDTIDQSIFGAATRARVAG